MHETKTAAFSQCQEEAHDFQISTFETVKAIQISQCKVLNYWTYFLFVNYLLSILNNIEAIEHMPSAMSVSFSSNKLRISSVNDIQDSNDSEIRFF